MRREYGGRDGALDAAGIDLVGSPARDGRETERSATRPDAGVSRLRELDGVVP